MKKRFQRNVRLERLERAADGSAPRGRLERMLISNRVINRALGTSAKWCLTALLWPRLVAPYRWELTRHLMPLVVDPVFAGYRILQLTDLHAGKARQSYLHGAIERCLEEKPDLIVLTGDLIDYHPRALPRVKELLALIVSGAPRDGVAAIFGNHDYHEYSWRHNGPRSARRIIHRRLVEIVEKCGIRLLRNQSLRISRPTSCGTAELVLVGLDEMWTGLADPAAAFGGVSSQDAVICLQHNPDGVEFLEPYPWQFMLCGHSHGGQANFPVLGPLYVPMERREFMRGSFEFPLVDGQPAKLGRRRIFVSRGLGYSTPIRLRCRPEATVFTVTPVEYVGVSHACR